MKRMYCWSLGLCASAMFALALPAGAADSMHGSMSAMKVDCSAGISSVMMKGDAMHGDAMKGDAMKGDAMKGDAMKGDTDKDFMSMMAANHHQMMALANYESQCGKNDKAKAAATAMLKQGHDNEAKFPELNSTP